jgi:hypothetical protein
MPLQMILCPVKSKARSIKIDLKLDESGGAAVHLDLELQSISDKLQRFDLVVPGNAKEFRLLHRNMSLSVGKTIYDARRISIELADPLEPGKPREISLSFSWPDAVRHEDDQKGIPYRLIANIRAYGTPFSSALITGLGEFTVADLLVLHVQSPRGFKLEAATPAWRSPKDPSVAQGDAEWIVHDIGTHNPAKIDFIATRIGVAEATSDEIRQLRERNRTLVSEMRRLQSELGAQEEEVIRLTNEVIERERNVALLKRELSKVKKSRLLYALIGLGIGVLLFVCILSTMLLFAPDTVYELLPTTPTPTLTPTPTVTSTSVDMDVYTLLA